MLFVALWAMIAGCISAGTHGSIRRYQYAVPKRELEKAVQVVLSTNPCVRQDSLKNYYNDDSAYITMQIREPGVHNSYTIRFYGGSDYWDTATESELFIAYAYDDKNEGGSEGNGGVTRDNARLRNKLLGPFERQFISEIDKQLRVEAPRRGLTRPESLVFVKYSHCIRLSNASISIRTPRLVTLQKKHGSSKSRSGRGFQLN